MKAVHASVALGGVHLADPLKHPQKSGQKKTVHHFDSFRGPFMLTPGNIA